MSTASHDSSMELDPGRMPFGGAAAGSRPAKSPIWLDGDVLACACPECGAPMSIRLWLMVADCFRCGTSIELTEEQEQEALRLLRVQEEAKRAESREVAAAISPTMLRKPKPRTAPKPETGPPETGPPETGPPETGPPETGPEVSRPAEGVPSAPAPTREARPRQRPRRVAASEVHRGARAHIHDLYEKGGVAVFWGNLFKDLPAWLVSLVLHLVAMLLLGLWYDDPYDDSQLITLSTSLSPEDLEGEQGEIDQSPEDAFEFEDPGSIEIVNEFSEPGTAPEAEPEIEPIEPSVEPFSPVGIMPPTSVMRPMSTMPRAPMGRMFAGRDPQVRAHAVKEAGGTSFTEAAVARGLVFLSRHQNKDGSWSLHNVHNTPDCDETCNAKGHTNSDVAATALSLLPFLGAGQTHEKGQYAEVVTGGLRWLIEHQKEDGDLRDKGQMYAHGQAAIVLSEAYALTGDEQLREPAQLALNYIIRAQHRGGGWRYNPGEPGDTSVVGWQLMALKSGQMAYLHVPTKTFELAGVFLHDLNHGKKSKGRYGYQRGSNPTPAMTAEALLCGQYLGWSKDDPNLRAGVNYLLDDHFPNSKKPNIYYWYYGTQVMHHYGGTAWSRWNAKMRTMLVDLQETKGHAAGSWTPLGGGIQCGFADRGGRLFMTSLATCILEVYYRHMPIYGEEALLGFE